VIDTKIFAWGWRNRPPVKIEGTLIDNLI